MGFPANYWLFRWARTHIVKPCLIIPCQRAVQDLLRARWRPFGAGRPLFRQPRLRGVGLESRSSRAFQPRPHRLPRTAAELGREMPKPLAEYLAQALQVVTGAPSRSRCPSFKHPDSPDHPISPRSFTRASPRPRPPRRSIGTCSVSRIRSAWLDNSQGAVNQQEARDHRRAGQRRRTRFQQPDHGHPVECRGHAGAAQPFAPGAGLASSTSSAPAPPAPRSPAVSSAMPRSSR